MKNRKPYLKPATTIVLLYATTGLLAGSGQGGFGQDGPDDDEDC